MDARNVGGRLATPVILLILGRIRDINQRFARLAARLAAGTYAPRRFEQRRRPDAPKPRRQNPLPQKFGWLLPLVPQAVFYRSRLEHLLLRDSEMAALMQAAPATEATATEATASQATAADPAVPPQAASSPVLARACGPPKPA